MYTRDVKKCFYVQDKRNGRRYLVDTGAEFSILPASIEDKKRTSFECLLAANGTKVPVYGRRTVAMSFGNRSYSHAFLLADVTKPLLGVDFFNFHNIGIDTRGRRMFDLSNGQWFGGETNTDTICTVNRFGDRDSFSVLLDEFPEVTKPSFVNKSVSHGVSHYIPTMDYYSFRTNCYIWGFTLDGLLRLHA